MTHSPKRTASSFTAEENLCGKALLGIVCRGHVILTDLLRLSKEIPPSFTFAAVAAEAAKKEPASSSGGAYLMGLFSSVTDKKEDKSDDGKYNTILFDFSYLRNPEECENLIGSDDASSGADMRALENEFALAHRDALTRFYRVFESIFLYHKDLDKFVTDLSAGYYIQYTIEYVLLETEGRQLLCEAAYLYGMMLILMERHMQGTIRERIVIAFLRYCGKDGDLSRFDEICRLVRCTGRAHYSSAGQGDTNIFNEKLFSRFPLPGDLIRSLVGCLLSDDIYIQSPSFPSFNQRTTRLAKQASMLYVILYFQPSILRVERGTMREVVDKFFHDNWAVSLYAGMIVDVSEQWSRFEAAALALENWLQLPNVEILYRLNAKSIGQCLADLRKYLARGVLTDEFVMNNLNELLGCLRRCNVAMRWRILHKQVANSKYAKILGAKEEQKAFGSNQEPNLSVSDANVLTMMLLTSRFEDKLKTIVSQLIKNKGDIWRACRSEAVKKMMELSSYFSGDQALADIERNDALIKWFSGMAEEIESLSVEKKEHRTVTGRNIQLCVEALKDIELFDLIDRNSQVKNTLQTTRDLLLRMVRAVSITDDIIITMDNVSDMSYAQEAIESYVSGIHASVKKDPTTVSFLRGLFLKLASCLRGPTFRLERGSSQHLDAVKEHYSSFLVGLVRNILEVVPVSVFSVLLQIADIREKRLRETPSKIETESLKAIAQLDERYKLSMLTYELSVFAEGILAMESIVFGRTEINPRQLLDKGLHKELVQHVSAILHRTLQFQFKGDVKPSSIVDFQAASIKSFTSLVTRMESLRNAMEHCQDYIGTSGLKIWDEEFYRITAFNVEQESNKYVRNKILGTASCYQSCDAPIPIFAPTEAEPLYVSFIGRTMSCLLKVTEPQATTFSVECNGWFLADGTEVCGSQTFTLLCHAIQVCGLVGLDRLLSFRILNELQRFVKFYHSAVKSHGVLLEQIRETLFPDWKSPQDALRLYASATKKTQKLMIPVVTCLRRVGQAQLLRKMIRDELQLGAQIDAKQLHQSLSVANGKLMSQALERNNDLHGHLIPEDSQEVFDRITGMLDGTGVGDPLSTMFLAIEPLEGLPVVLALFVISNMEKFNYDHDFGSLVRARDEYPFDGWPVVAGMTTILKQFHPSFAKSFFSYLAQFIQSGIQSCLLPKSKSPKRDDLHQLPSYMRNVLIFMDHMCSISGVQRAVFYEHIPENLLALLHDV